MIATRISAIALICLAAGCQSVNRSSEVASRKPVDDATALAAEPRIETGSAREEMQHASDSILADASGSHLVARAGEVESSPSGPAPITRPGLRVKPVSHQQPVEAEEEGIAASPAIETVVEPILEPLEAAEPEAEMLRLEDLESIALQNNPALCEAVALVEAAQGEWLQAGLSPNPVVGYSGQQLGSGGAAEQRGLYLGQEIVTGKKLQLNREVAAWEIDRAQWNLDAVQRRVLTDVRIGYYNVLIAQRRRELATELVHISDQGVKAAEALFKSLEVGEADPLRARVEADSAAIVLQTSINQHQQAWRQLAAVLGTPNRPLQTLVGDLDANEAQLSWEETLQELQSESPEIAAALADVEAARWAVQRAHAEVIPNVEVQAVIQDDRGTGSANANLQVSLPIPILNRNQGGIRRAEAQAAAAERAVDRLTLDLQARLAEAFQRYESAQNQVDVYSRADGILAKTQRSLELVRQGYEGGETGVQDLLFVQQTYFETNLAYLDSLQQLWVSVMEIRGLLLQGSLLGETVSGN